MKRSFIGIVAGIYLFILSIVYWIFFKNPPVGLFIILFDFFGLMLIVSGIFEHMEYYNKNSYFIITAGTLIGMFILSYFQTSLPAYQNNLILSYVLIGIFTASIIYLAHGFTRRWGK